MRDKDQGQIPHAGEHRGVSPSAVHGAEEMRSRGRKNDRTRGGGKRAPTSARRKRSPARIRRKR